MIRKHSFSVRWWKNNYSPQFLLNVFQCNQCMRQITKQLRSHRHQHACLTRGMNLLLLFAAAILSLFGSYRIGAAFHCCRRQLWQLIILSIQMRCSQSTYSNIFTQSVACMLHKMRIYANVWGSHGSRARARGWWVVAWRRQMTCMQTNSL